jgi:hypothetical protein
VLKEIEHRPWWRRKLIRRLRNSKLNKVFLFNDVVQHSVTVGLPGGGTFAKDSRTHLSVVGLGNRLLFQS